MRNGTQRRVTRKTPDDASITAATFKKKTQVPNIIVESADDTQCEVLRDIYIGTKSEGLPARVRHLFLLCWSIKSGKLCCTLEQYKNTEEGLPQLHNKFVRLEITCAQMFSADTSIGYTTRLRIITRDTLY